ncbi:MAG TPA: glycosyltransferase family 1 protein [Porphyromonadaceae bacterium]|nr:glycosyltransferase family 1 protein [Porphyromonadaceae bacterium]
MRIAFDAKRATHNRTGLGNYSRFILNTLAKYNPENEYLLYTPSLGKSDLRSKVSKHESIVFKYPNGFWNKIGMKSIWRSYGVTFALNKEPMDIYHGLSNEIPFGLKKNKIKSIVTIHDLIFIRYPEYYKPIDRMIYNFKFKKACQKADHIIAVSEMTKKDIVKYYNIDENKISVVYQGCDASFKKIVPDSFKETIRYKYNLPDKFILSVGTIESRKNLLLAVKALKNTKQKHHLVAIGKPTPYLEQVKKYIHTNGLEDQVTFLHDVPFTDLPAIYQMANIFVYPSFFEGFGIPIIEALYSGIPVIAATGSCLEEAGGPDSLYVDPLNDKELSALIDRISENPTLRESMIQNGFQYVKQFEPENIISKLENIYQTMSSINRICKN